ncbi:hypothetical protein [Listeria booriae]|uniref:hypothetical protein n=1 Tax=Listeria booriae TaxID=1552123 RepID=UPI001E485181|nr:hypothetical protein [Listeria booriae]MCD2208575.1 hypothetical protein [Listeria booriae]
MMDRQEYFVILRADLAQKIYSNQPEFNVLANKIRAGEFEETSLDKGGTMGVLAQKENERSLVSDLFLPDETYNSSVKRLNGEVLFFNMDSKGQVVPWNSTQEQFLEQITYLQHDTLQLDNLTEKEPLVYLCGNQFKRDFECGDSLNQREINNENSNRSQAELSILNFDMNTIVSKMHFAHGGFFPSDRVKEMIMNLDGSDYDGEYYVPHDMIIDAEWDPKVGFRSDIAGYENLHELEEDLKMTGLYNFALSDAMDINPSKLWKDNLEELSRDKGRTR